MNDQDSGVTVESNKSVKNLKSMFEGGAKKNTEPLEPTTVRKTTMTTEKKANNAWIKNKPAEDDEPRRNTYDPKLLMQAAAASQGQNGEDFKSVINKFNQKPKPSQEEEDLKRRKEEAKNKIRPEKKAANTDQPQLEQKEYEEINEADEIQESAHEEEEEHHE